MNSHLWSVGFFALGLLIGMIIGYTLAILLVVGRAIDPSDEPGSEDTVLRKSTANGRDER